MKSVLLHVLKTFLPVMILSCLLPASLFAEEKVMTIGTGNVVGVYYGAGSAVAKMHNMKRKEYGAWLVSEESDGSVENIGKVVTRQRDFGIAQSNTLYYAWSGNKGWDESPKRELRTVIGLYIEDITLVASESSEIVSPDDLQDKRINVGGAGSSDHETSRMVLQELGIDPELDVELFENDSYRASERLHTGEIDAYFYTVAHPNLSIMEAIDGEERIRIVPFKKDFIEKVDASHPFMYESQIEIDYYDGLLNDDHVPTLGVKAILFTHKDTAEETVYRVVKQVMENLDLFRRQHPAFSKLTAEKMATKTILPLHPGAERYFKETRVIE